jgi:hypothetical protein
MRFIFLILFCSCASNYKALNPTMLKGKQPVFTSSERLGEITLLSIKARDLHGVIKNTSDQPLTIDLNLATQKLKSEKKTSSAKSFWYEGCGSRDESCKDPRVILNSKEEIEVHWDFDHYGMGRFNLPLKKDEGIVDVINISFQKL